MQPPARGLDRLGPVLRGGAGCGQRQSCQEHPAKARLDLPTEALLNRNQFAELELVDLAQPKRAEVKSQARDFLAQKRWRELVPRQNMPAEGEEERVDRMARQVIFCGAASARASICACKAFNTEESVGSMR